MSLSIGHSTGQSKLALLRRQRRQPGGSTSAAYGAGGSVSGPGSALNTLQLEGGGDLHTEADLPFILEG